MNNFLFVSGLGLGNKDFNSKQVHCCTWKGLREWKPIMSPAQASVLREENFIILVYKLMEHIIHSLRRQFLEYTCIFFFLSNIQDSTRKDGEVLTQNARGNNQYVEGDLKPFLQNLYSWRYGQSCRNMFVAEQRYTWKLILIWPQFD